MAVPCFRFGPALLTTFLTLADRRTVMLRNSILVLAGLATVGGVLVANPENAWARRRCCCGGGYGGGYGGSYYGTSYGTSYYGGANYGPQTYDGTTAAPAPADGTVP